MKIFRFWKPIIISIVIFYGSVTSSENLNGFSLFDFQNSDKLIHFLLYFSLSITFISSLTQNSKIQKRYKLIFTLLLIILYGVIMEFIQYNFTETRSAEVFDVIANTLGCITGVSVFQLIKKFTYSKYL